MGLNCSKNVQAPLFDERGEDGMPKIRIAETLTAGGSGESEESDDVDQLDRLDGGNQRNNYFYFAKEKLQRKMSLEDITDDVLLELMPENNDNHGWDSVALQSELSWCEQLALRKHVHAIRNSGVPAKPRAVLPRIEDAEGTFYRVSDGRLRAEFNITNHEQTKCFRAELLVDSGANSDLKLTARKAMQFGLKILEKSAPTPTRGSTNHRGSVYKFYPPVWVSAVFIRDGKKETKTGQLIVSADKDDYDELLLDENTKQNVEARLDSPSWFGGLKTPHQPIGSSHLSDSEGTFVPGKPIALTPILHRPKEHPDRQAVLGIEGMHKLGIHLNSELRQLEMEEEEYLEEYLEEEN